MSRRKPFQFSLRKLLLWTLWWAAFFGAERWAGISIAVLILYVAFLVGIRLHWGYQRGMEIAVLATGIGCAVLASIPFLALNHTEVPQYSVEVLFGCLLGTIVGLYIFLLVHGAICASERFVRMWPAKARHGSCGELSGRCV